MSGETSMNVVLFWFVLYHHVDSTANDGWDYTTDWVTDYQECGYNHQSPIDIELTDCGESDEIYLDWSHHLQHYAIHNNGHSLQAIPFQVSHAPGGELSFMSNSLHHTNETNVKLRNSFYDTYRSPINSEYCFDSLHFHWGADDTEGSEHVINGERFPLELHLVHFSCDYDTSATALEAYHKAQHDPDYEYDDEFFLAVIAVLFELGDEGNAILDGILDDIIIGGVREYYGHDKATETHLLKLYYSDFDVDGLLPSSHAFVGYQGSLTTPPCYETVRWFVMKETMSVSSEQLEQFRSLLQSQTANDSIAPNYRALQKINHRKVYQCAADIELESVEKDEAHEAGEGGETLMLQSVKDQTWFIIGIAFICLFLAAVCVIIQGVVYLCNMKKAEEEFAAKSEKATKKSKKKRSKRTKQVAGGEYHGVSVMTGTSSTHTPPRTQMHSDNEDEYEDEEESR